MSPNSSSDFNCSQPGLPSSFGHINAPASNNCHGEENEYNSGNRQEGRLRPASSLDRLSEKEAPGWRSSPDREDDINQDEKKAFLGQTSTESDLQVS
ncbi:unnamed protein product [Protopolystoma xenopodis]|uniref:Uncharacterized protein n=1 Tax=Protopolystoma xenopodis TaxID=117903 RepID=A0A3S5C2Z9_9PLAT|nr:unnamed protein product [Protopolystoma xenopodis]